MSSPLCPCTHCRNTALPIIAFPSASSPGRKDQFSASAPAGNWLGLWSTVRYRTSSRRIQLIPLVCLPPFSGHLNLFIAVRDCTGERLCTKKNALLRYPCQPSTFAEVVRHPLDCEYQQNVFSLRTEERDD